MQIDRLSLRGFRNYEDAQAQFVPGVNLLVGGNANGKTNLLEAVSYLSTGRSFRTRREAELIRFGADFAELRAQPCCFPAGGRASCGSPGSGSAAAPLFPACSRACCSARRTL